MNEFKDEGELIDSSRISVVIQGLTHHVKDDKNCMFYQCIDSIKKHLPHAEIIISTWKNQTCDESIVDRVLYNDEPESITSEEDINFKWNFNKMVVSTRNGIIVSNKEYVLKFRADLLLLGTNFFKISKKNNIPKKLNQYKILNTPINISNIFTKTPFSSFYYFLYYLSDIAQFGKKENILDLWSRELLNESALRHFVKQDFFFNHYSRYKLRMSAEQALMIGWLNAHGHNINLPYASYITKNELYLSELSLSLNFNLINWDQTDILYPIRFSSNPAILNKYVYQAEELNHLYKKYNFFILNKRFYSSMKLVYLDKIFSIFFWDLISKRFLLWLLSPELYSTLKTRWRAALNKKHKDD